LAPGLVLFPFVGSFSGSSAAAASFHPERKREASTHSSPRSDYSSKVPFSPAQSTAPVLHSISCRNGGCSIAFRASPHPSPPPPPRPSPPARRAFPRPPDEGMEPAAAAAAATAGGASHLRLEVKRKFKLTKMLAEEPRTSSDLEQANSIHVAGSLAKL
jgi:hypothetical protein